MTAKLGSRVLEDENGERQFPASKAISPSRHCGRQVGFSVSGVSSVETSEIGTAVAVTS